MAVLARVAAVALTLCAASDAKRVDVTHKRPTASRIAAARLLRGGSVPLSPRYDKEAEFCVSVTVGGQPFCLDLDTGSSDVGIVAEGCHGCPKKEHDPWHKTASAEALNCSWCDDHTTERTDLACKTIKSAGDSQVCCMQMSYADNSGFGAVLYEDSFAFGDGGASVVATVGAIYSAKEWNDPKDIDGIVGFAGRRESSANVASPFDLYVKQGMVSADVFSLCLRDQAGVLYLGDDDDFVRSPEVVWTERLASSDFYAVGLSDVIVNGKSIGVDPTAYTDGDAIVDSGTSDTCFAKPAFVALRQAFEDLCAAGVCLKGICNCDEHRPLTNHGIFGERRCVHMDATEVASYPNVTLAFTDGAAVVSTPASYLRNDEWAACDENQYTIAFTSCGSAGSGTILGASFMLEHVVVHDRVKGRLGFLPGVASCP